MKASMDSMDSTLATARPHPALSNTRMSKLEPNGRASHLTSGGRRGLGLRRRLQRLLVGPHLAQRLRVGNVRHREPRPLAAERTRRLSPALGPDPELLAE